MNSYRNNPDGEDNLRETKQNDAEIFSLQMTERNQMNAYIEKLEQENKELKLENDILRKMNEATRQYNEQLLADRAEMQACTGLPELKPITTQLAPAPKPIEPFPKGRWQHL